MEAIQSSGSGAKKQKNPMISPNKKQMAMANERAPGLAGAGLKGAASDIGLSVEGARGSISGPNSENSMFNKHYNKELKLCEGKLIALYSRDV